MTRKESHGRRKKHYNKYINLHKPKFQPTSRVKQILTRALEKDDKSQLSLDLKSKIEDFSTKGRELLSEYLRTTYSSKNLSEHEKFLSKGKKKPLVAKFVKYDRDVLDIQGKA